jgi:hypothetical protein
MDFDRCMAAIAQPSRTHCAMAAMGVVSLK